MDPHFHNKIAKWNYWYLTTVFAPSVLQFSHYLFLAAVVSSAETLQVVMIVWCQKYIWAYFLGFHIITSSIWSIHHQWSHLYRSTSSEIALKLVLSLLNSELMQAQQKQQPACRPNRETCSFCILTASNWYSCRAGVEINIARPKDSLDTLRVRQPSCLV